LFELFNNRKITLVHPSLWEDPYENFILKSKVKLSSGEIKDYTFHEDFYGQCWSLHKASDAMWRIYSKDCDAVRIKTTVRKLLGSLYNGGSNKPSMSCIVGKVQYLSEKSLKRFANSIYVNGELTKENLFRSLLVKRLAFKHESEIRLLYFDLDRKVKGDFYFFDIQPDELIEQIMLDTRCTYNEFEDFKTEILEKTSFSGPIKRSLLYTAPENIELNDNPS
jgi:hypothetical protein